MKPKEATKTITGIQEGVLINTLFYFFKTFCKIFVKSPLLYQQLVVQSIM